MKADTMPEPPAPPTARIVSMDQFRGYTVMGMFLVNFLGEYAAIHPVLKHNDHYFSYADSIMPSFMFACGFSYRLVALRTLAKFGPGAGTWRFIGRSLGLVLVSLMLFGFGEEFKHWSEVTPKSAWLLFILLLKANLWEVLAIIGVGQLVILPVIARSTKTLLGTMVGFLVLHVVISYFFNFDFVFGRPNTLDGWLGTTGHSAWDGGFFGLLPWSALMLAGAIVHDMMVASKTPARAAAKLLAIGVVLMGLGYGLSCLSKLYQGEVPIDKQNTAASPVLPPFEKAKGQSWQDLLVEWPLVEPPPPSERPFNYWMMNKKRATSLPFTLFSMGWAAALYGVFVVACDSGGLAIGLFRTFGQNALAAYVIHEMVEKQIHTLVPDDAPLSASLVGLAVFFAITYIFVRYLENQKIYIRL